ncbi:hypothetical protein CK203_047242 [Vitis vinifera]|uniref:Uncharacterized protein n=1 Tax=Vitis vinifera TaxID=29760 RepID=A0A438HZ41_VITVI|nr:hypothetical protein CK203_047242 [Vitis vinifera]
MTPNVPSVALTTSKPSITISTSEFHSLEATIDAITSVDPQDEPQTVDTVTATPDDASSPPEAPTT